MSLFKSSWVTHQPFRDFITTGVWLLATLLQLVRHPCYGLLVIPCPCSKNNRLIKVHAQKRWNISKNTASVCISCAEKPCISSMCRTVKAKSGWSQNVNRKYNTCYEFSGWQRDGETKIAGQRRIVYMLAICHPRGCATRARSNQVILLMDKTPGRVFFCHLNGMILPFCLACITLFAGLCPSPAICLPNGAKKNRPKFFRPAPHPGLCTRSSGWRHSSSGACRGGVIFYENLVTEF